MHASWELHWLVTSLKVKKAVTSFTLSNPNENSPAPLGPVTFSFSFSIRLAWAWLYERIRHPKIQGELCKAQYNLLYSICRSKSQDQLRRGNEVTLQKGWISGGVEHCDPFCYTTCSILKQRVGQASEREQ